MLPRQGAIFWGLATIAACVVGVLLVAGGGDGWQRFDGIAVLVAVVPGIYLTVGFGRLARDASRQRANDAGDDEDGE